MSGQTNVTAKTPATCGAQNANQGNSISSPTNEQMEKHRRKEEVQFTQSIDQQPSENESERSADEANQVQDSAANKPGILTQYMNPEELPISDSVVQPLTTVFNDNPKPSTAAGFTEDKVPDEILKLINGKSPEEVVQIINGQLAELKAIETLRDVEEECLDELTNEIIAKITKESVI